MAEIWGEVLGFKVGLEKKTETGCVHALWTERKAKQGCCHPTSTEIETYLWSDGTSPCLCCARRPPASNSLATSFTVKLLSVRRQPTQKHRCGVSTAQLELRSPHLYMQHVAGWLLQEPSVSWLKTWSYSKACGQDITRTQRGAWVIVHYPAVPSLKACNHLIWSRAPECSAEYF